MTSLPHFLVETLVSFRLLFSHVTRPAFRYSEYDRWITTTVSVVSELNASIVTRWSTARMKGDGKEGLGEERREEGGDWGERLAGVGRHGD